jgi:aspartyl protease family protein
MRFGAFFVATVAIGGLVGWFAPGAPQPAPAAAPDALAANAKKHLELARSAPRRSDEVVLQRDANGHYYAEVATDTGKALMLVDTGATVVALTGNDASMMGVNWSPGDVRPVARGASGDVYGVPVVIDRLEVGGIEARRVQAVVVPEDLDISLLGQSFLSKVNRVEVSGDEMILHD